MWGPHVIPFPILLSNNLLPLLSLSPTFAGLWRRSSSSSPVPIGAARPPLLLVPLGLLSRRRSGRLQLRDPFNSGSRSSFVFGCLPPHAGWVISRRATPLPPVGWEGRRAAAHSSATVDYSSSEISLDSDYRSSVSSRSSLASVGVRRSTAARWEGYRGS
jgi:hypothetical protein